MKRPLRRTLALLLCCWLYSTALAAMPAGTWRGDGLVQSIALSHGWTRGTIILSQAHAQKSNELAPDLYHLRSAAYRVDVNMIIAVKEAEGKVHTIILGSDKFSYNIVLHYNTKRDRFEVVWFDRHDLEIPNEKQLLIRQD